MYFSSKELVQIISKSQKFFKISPQKGLQAIKKDVD